MLEQQNLKVTMVGKENFGSLSTNKTVQEVAKGTIIIFIGTLIGILLEFIGRTMFARFFGPSEYGIFSLGASILSIAAIIGAAGLREGTSRQIAYYRGKKQIKKIQSVIHWSLFIGITAGIFISLALFLSSEVIASNIFDMPKLSFPLKMLSIAIPFYVIIFVLTSIFRGFKNFKEKIYFEEIGRRLFFLILLTPIILTSTSYVWGIMAYGLSVIITGFGFFIYFSKRELFRSKLFSINLDKSVGKELLIFSLPLLLVSILYQFMSWTDTLMLGFLKTSDAVGLYNSARPLGRFISAALITALFVYTPIVTDLFAKRNIIEISKSFAVLTKWVCAATFPLMSIFVLYPKIVIEFLFGYEYVMASASLQILAVGFFINNFMGPNGATLIAIGKAKFLMWATLAAATINVALNFLLIPKYGINGAALATIIALVSVNSIRSFKLFSYTKIHPFKKNVFKPVLVGSIFIFSFYFIVKKFITITFWMFPILFILFSFVYVISLLITRSFDKEDIELLFKIEKKVGINLKIIKKLLKKFS